MADLLFERTVQTGIQAIRLRGLTTIGEMDQVVDLEEQIWGYGAPGSDSPYPARALFAVAESGGLVAGAFAGGDLVGFALSWLGSENGTRVPYLHSQLMGVLPAYRSHGIGYHLKLFQRDYALNSGLELIKWTFDPLLAANAHLNLKKLGSVIRSYLPNYYGNLQSRFTRGIASDRVWVSWFVKSQRVRGRLDRSSPSRSAVAELPRATRVRPDPISGLARLSGFRLDLDSKRLLVEVPGDFSTLRRTEPKLAREWQRKIREIFVHYLNRSYCASDFFFMDGRGAYLLDRSPLPQILNSQ